LLGGQRGREEDCRHGYSSLETRQQFDGMPHDSVGTVGAAPSGGTRRNSLSNVAFELDREQRGCAALSTCSLEDFLRGLSREGTTLLRDRRGIIVVFPLWQD
jgi:hypothetical protein